MPSIQIGSSSIGGDGFALTGPAGNTGPMGETGNIGLLGITAGPTGATGVYIKQVTTSTNPLSAGVYFYLSDGTTIGPISGFTGPSITYYNSKGVSAAFASEYFSAFVGVSGGMTFAFRGICGDGQYTTTALSPDGTEVILTINDIPSGSVLFGNTFDNFIAFTNTNFTATTSRIRVQNQLSEDDSSASTFKSNFNYAVLEFGLTANPDTNTVSQVKSFADFTTPFITINGLNRNFTPGSVPITDGIKNVDSGGYVIDLDKSSVFKLTTPIGITAFSRKRADNQLRSWLFFIEGSDVWNFPQNVLFENGITGIQNYAFGSGMNILRIETPMDGNLTTYNASFVDRFFGSDVPVDYGGIGSCCYAGGCEDYVTREYCEDTRMGVFNALISCENSCRVGSCCIDGTCHDRVSESVCTTAGGAWNNQTCDLRGPCSLYYILETVQPPTITQTTFIDNTASSGNTATVAIFKVKTNDTNTKVVIPKTTDSNGFVYGLFHVRDKTKNYDITSADNAIGTYTLTNSTGTDGVTFALQFDNQTDQIQEGVPYSLANFEIKLKNSSDVQKASLVYKIQPKYVDSCAGRPNSKLIKSEWLAKRYCRDCYIQDPTTGVNYFYPVQSQYGSCDFCLDLQKTGSNYTVTPICMTTSEVEDTNDCTITTENNFSPDPAVAAGCKHSEWNIGSGINNCSPPCDQAIDVLLNGGSVQAACKGISLANQDKYPYWHNVSVENISKLYGNLTSAGVTLNDDYNYITSYITDFIENSNNTENQKAVLFTAENENKGVTFITQTELAACCPAKPDDKVNDILLNFDDPNNPADIRYFVIYTSFINTGVCEGRYQDPKLSGSCRFYTAERYVYALIFKTWCEPGTNIIKTAESNCLVDIIQIENTTISCTNTTSSKCIPSNCKYDRDSDYSIDAITEIKITDTTPIPGSQDRKLILNRIVMPPRTTCNSSSSEYSWDLKDTVNWYTSTQEYALVQAQLSRIFWYPMFCGDCDGSVLGCFGTECRSVCFTENGSPLRPNTGAGAKLDCTILPSPSEYKNVIIQKTSGGPGTTVLTPKIYGGDPVTELTNEYFYYTLGHPSDPADPSSIYMWACDGETRIRYKIEKALSGTPISIPTTTLQNNEFVVYYTNGENVPFYNWSVDGCSSTVRTAPVRMVKKYKDTNSTIPQIDFTADVSIDYDSGYFTAVLRSRCTSLNGQCIPVDTDGFNYYIAGTKWKLDGWQINYWYEYDGNIINWSTEPTASFSSGSVTDTILSLDGSLVYFDKVPTSGYSNVTYVNIHATLILSLIDTTDGSFRTVEKTKIISVPRAPISLTSSSRRLNKYKLITDENGNSQCVLMDCSVTTDCNTLPDC